jgi:hypothetical protein
MKLSINDLRERVKAIASDELLESIAGGNANACHIIAKVGDVTFYQP